MQNSCSFCCLRLWRVALPTGNRGRPERKGQGQGQGQEQRQRLTGRDGQRDRRPAFAASLGSIQVCASQSRECQRCRSFAMASSSAPLRTPSTSTDIDMEFEPPPSTGGPGNGSTSCRWCGRLVGLSGVRPRRERGLECISCPVVLAENYPEANTKESKKQLEDTLKSDPGARTDFMGYVTDLEEAIELGKRGRGRRRMVQPGRTTAQIQQSTSIEGNTCLGVCWPESIYELPEHFGEKVPKIKRQWRETGSTGKKTVGIVLSAARGAPTDAPPSTRSTATRRCAPQRSATLTCSALRRRRASTTWLATP